MSVSIALPITVKKERTEKIYEVRVPHLPNSLKRNKFLKAFFTVLSSPVK